MSGNSFQDLISFVHFIAQKEKHHSFVLSPSFEHVVTDVQGIIKHVKAGVELHMPLNQTDLKGRRSTNIIGSRALCVDDAALEAANIKLFTPHLTVESSPGKYHYYWKVSHGFPLELWSKVQLALAWKFSADRSLSQITHLIRVPGVERVCKSGEVFTPRILEFLTNEVPLEAKLMDEKFGDINLFWKEAKDFEATQRRALRAALTGSGKAIDKSIGRNNALYVVLKDFVRTDSFKSYDDALYSALKINTELFSGNELSESEVSEVAKSAWKRGIMGLERQREREASALSLLHATPLSTEITYTANRSYKGNVIEAAEAFKGKGGVNGIDSSNGHSGYLDDGYLYDRYSEKAIANEVTSRFKEKLFFKDDMLFAFSDKERVWCPQKGVKAELYDMCDMVISDLITSRDFRMRFCEEDGVPSDVKTISALGKFNSAGTSNRVAGLVLIGSTPVSRYYEDIFDGDKDLVFTQAGVLNLRTKEVRRAEASDYLLRKVSVKWNPNAQCRRWEKFLKEVFGENEDSDEMVSFMQEVFGYTLSGYRGEDKIFCHYGAGSNGKSKVMSALLKMCGTYGTLIESERVVHKKNAFQAASERLGVLVEGRRACIVDDLDVASKWNEAVIKNLTGENFKARELYAESKTIKNRCKFHFGMNRMPEPEAENYGILRRICVVPYVARFRATTGESERIDALISEELEGILRWAVEGFDRYIERKAIKYPEEVELAIGEYKQDSFVIEGRLDALFEIDNESWLSIEEIKQCVDIYFAGENRIEFSNDRIGKTVANKFGIKRNQKRVLNERKWGYNLRKKKQYFDSIE